MNIRTLPYSLGLFSVLREILYTFARLNEDPLASSFVPTFQSLRSEWKSVQEEEIDIIDALALADAIVDKADAKIDVFATKSSRIVDDVTTGATRKRIRQSLFKGKPLSKFKRPVLGQQLVAMADWNTTFAESGVPELVALGAEHGLLIQMGEQADEKRKAAQKKNRDFRDVGKRKQFIDKLNAARQEVAGALAKLPFEHPGLPSGYAEGFFLRDIAQDEEPTIDEVKSTIEELEGKLVAQKALLETLEKEAEAQRQAEAQKQAQAEEAEQLEAQAKALLEQAAELKRRAGKK
jgi:DNA repair exonuclease SbcCD ATPase subunit